MKFFCLNPVIMTTPAYTALAKHELPFELIQETTEHLCHDCNSLRNLCLVSQTWRAAAVVHLFSEIRLSTQRDFDTWLEITRRTPTLANRSLKKVTHNVSEAKPYIPPPIPDPIPIRTDVLRYKGHPLSSVPGLYPRTIRGFASLARISIRSLEVTGQFADSLELGKVLAAASVSIPLASLTLDGVFLHSQVKPQNCYRIDSTRLESISLRASNIKWFSLTLATFKPIALVSLSINGVYPFDWETYITLIDASADTLRHLHLDLLGWPTAPLQLSGSLVALETLEININGRSNMAQNCFIAALPQAPKVTHVTFELNFRNPRQFNTEMSLNGWPSAARLILSAVSNLQLLTFRFVAQPIGRQLRDDIETLIRFSIPDFGNDSRFICAWVDDKGCPLPE
ncbi:hypothetical protein C8J56DRAFT_971511 [Mycena floridula]|nr:hypothetical protein C8J56DRAFT_974826 [Mycena floridula]KAJ7577309.1 hypothetical protein C8J56DRAFT_971511 [Mycena floridula]